MGDIKMKKIIQNIGLAAYKLMSQLLFFKIPIVNRLFNSSYFYYKKHLEASDYKALHEYINGDSVIVDVGAAMGFYSLIFGSWVSPKGKVYAFEPDLDNYQCLNDNINNSKSNLSKKIVTFNTGVSNKIGATGFRLDRFHPGNHRIDYSSEFKVPVTTLDFFSNQNRIIPNFIKIDVQGHEHEVLLGAIKLIREHSPILYVEFDFVENSKSCIATWDLLKDCRYESFKFEKSGSFQLYTEIDFRKDLESGKDYFDLLWFHNNDSKKPREKL